MRNSWDLRWEVAQLRRAVQRDHRWRVELYGDVASDPGHTPNEEASQLWICSDRAAAASFARILVDHLRHVGDQAPLPSP